MNGMDEAEQPPRCPECCAHGIPYNRNCGWCQDWEDGVDYGVPAADEPMWLCPHGVGVEIGAP